MSIGSAELVWERWEYLAKGSPDREAIIHWDALNGPTRLNYGQLIGAALNVAGHLLARGVGVGDVCAIIMRHNKLFYPVYMGIAAIGAIPAVLAYPNQRLHPEKFKDGLLGMTRHSGLKWILTESDLEVNIKPLISNNDNLLKALLFPLEWDIDACYRNETYREIKNIRKDIVQSDPFLLQYSSGTTGLQKGVILSNKSILEHVQSYSKAIALTSRDKIISWLPFYHDMGLIAAFHLPLAFGIPVIQIDPFQWTYAPVLLLQAASEEKATLAWQPNFAYNFMADRIQERDMNKIELESVRMFINCSECVRAESQEKFYSRFSAYGLKRSALAACYAMAEATFAVTQTSPGSEARKIAVDRCVLSKGIVEETNNKESQKICVSSGKPVPGCALKIIDERGKGLPEGRVGEIAIRSVSLFSGYLNSIEMTAEVIRDGWYLTGDYGFVDRGEYYIVGRKKDIIIVAGKNIYPEDIEDAVNKISGVVAGRSIAFGVEDQENGTEKICIIAETSCDEVDKERLKINILKAVMEIDLTVSEVYLVPPKWLIKTSSGKPCRKTNKERILKDDIGTFKKSYS